MGACGSKPEVLEVKREASLQGVSCVKAEKAISEANPEVKADTAPVAGSSCSTLPPWMKQVNAGTGVTDGACGSKTSMQDPIAEVLRINLSEVCLAQLSLVSTPTGECRFLPDVYMCSERTHPCHASPALSKYIQTPEVGAEAAELLMLPKSRKLCYAAG
jgi:hypothetical protein